MTEQSQRSVSVGHVGSVPVGHVLDVFLQPGIVFDTRSLAIIEANVAACECYGYDRDEFIKLAWIDLVAREDVQRFKEDVLDQLDDSRRVWSAWRHVRKNGSVFQVDVVTHGMQWGDQLRQVASIMPVGDSLPFVVRAGLLDEESRERLDLILHDLRTPLTSVVGFAVTLLREDTWRSPELCRDLVARLAENARWLTKSITEEVEPLVEQIALEDAEAVAADLRFARRQLSELGEACFTAGKHLLNVLRWASINPGQVRTSSEALERVWPAAWTYDAWCAWHACRLILRRLSGVDEPWEVTVISNDRRRRWRTSGQHVDLGIENEPPV